MATWRFIAVHLMELLARWVPSAPELEAKALFGRHIWDMAQLADQLGHRTEYRDGLKAAVLQLDGHVADETFAARLAGQKKPESCLFWLPPPPGAAFLEALSSHVETFLATGKPPYPVERTQLTGGILDYALESLATNSKRLETPDLDIRYEAPEDSGFLRGDYSRPVKKT